MCSSSGAADCVSAGGRIAQVQTSPLVAGRRRLLVGGGGVELVNRGDGVGCRLRDHAEQVRGCPLGWDTSSCSTFTCSLQRQYPQSRTTSTRHAFGARFSARLASIVLPSDPKLRSKRSLDWLAGAMLRQQHPGYLAERAHDRSAARSQTRKRSSLPYPPGRRSSRSWRSPVAAIPYPSASSTFASVHAR